MSTHRYFVQQYVDHANQYEDIPEGGFDDRDAAVSGMNLLVSDLGWSDLRVVDKRDGSVVAESDDDDDDAELTTRAKMLLNNSLDWYVVTFDDGSHELRHQSSLSSILECGEDPEQFGIVNYEQCWNGEDLSTEDDWV